MRADDALLAEATGSEVGETLFGFFFLGGGGGGGGGGELSPFSFLWLQQLGCQLREVSFRPSLWLKVVVGKRLLS